jgi:protoporphyrin/coproporphyrin ferrochelatase
VHGWSAACAASGMRLPIIFTAHSVPQRTIDAGDPYASQTRHTAELVAAQAGLSERDWAFAFQSQGMSGGPWLGPTVEETIVRLKEAGHSGVFIQPIGFVCDHVEVLYDIDIAFKNFAEAHGLKLWRAESLNDSPLFINAVGDVARARLALKQGVARS